LKKETPIFTLIKSMTSTEKAYFKKYAFKKKNDSNDSFKRMFDMIDKQSVFKLEKIAADKKINKSLKKNFSSSLSNLYKRIIFSLLEYRKEKNSLSIIFDMFLEYNLYLEKGLYELAKKKIAKAENFAKEKNIYYQIPQIAYWQFRYLRGNTKVSKVDLKEKTANLSQSIRDIQSISQSELITLKLEMMIHENNGLIIKNEKDKRSIAILILQTEELLEDLLENVQLHSILNSNMFIMNLMLGRLKNIYKMTVDYLDFFNQKIIDVKSHGTKYDCLVYIKNLSVVQAHFNEQELLEKCIQTISEESKLLHEENLIQRMKNNALYLNILNIAINDLDYTPEMLELCIQTFLSEDKNKIYYFEFLMPILIILIRKKDYKKALDLSATAINDGFNSRSRDSYLSIRMIRAIAWLKLESFQMFEFELTTTYKYLLKDKGFYFNIQIINFVKKYSKLILVEDKRKLLKKLLKEFETIKNEGTGTEKLKAIELKIILQLVF